MKSVETVEVRSSPAENTVWVTSRALGSCPPSAAFRGALSKRPYVEAKRRRNGVPDIPRRGFPALLQLPSMVRYLKFLVQLGRRELVHGHSDSESTSTSLSKTFSPVPPLSAPKNFLNQKIFREESSRSLSSERGLVKRLWLLVSASTLVFLGWVGRKREKKFRRSSLEKDRLKKDLLFSPLFWFDWLLDDFGLLNDLWVFLKAPALLDLSRSDDFRQKPWIWVLHLFLWQSAVTAVKNVKVIKIRGKTVGWLVFPDITSQPSASRLSSDHTGREGYTGSNWK